MLKEVHIKNKLCLLITMIFILANFNLPDCIKAADAVNASPTITMSSTTPGITDKVDVTIDNGSTDSGAWVGLYNENDKPGATADGGVESIWWKGLVDELKIQNGNGKFTLDLSSVGLEAGKTYKLVLFKDGGYTVDASINFQTKASTIPTNPTNSTNPQNGPTITMSNTNPGITDKVDVTIANGSTDSGAWIGLYNENDKPGATADGGVESIWWKGLVDELKIHNGNGKFTLDLSTVSIIAGNNYKLVIFKDGGYTIDASVNFNIKSSPNDNTKVPSLTMPNTLVGIMDTIEVDIANASSDPGAWIGIYNENDKPGSQADGGIASMWWRGLNELDIQNGKFYINLDSVTGRERGKTYKIILFKDSGYTVDASVEFKISQPEVKKYSLEAVQIKTQAGTAPTMPTTVIEDNSDGTTSKVDVTWDKIDSYLYSKAGSFTVEGTVAGSAEKARVDVEVTEGSGPLYTFDILSDTHIKSDPGFIHDLNLDYALKEMNKLDPSSSGLIINGDTVDSGLEENWQVYAQILNQNKHPKVDLSLGNHDTWQENYWIDQNEYAKSKQNFLKYSGAPNVYYDDWINGNHFVFLGSERSDGNTAYFSDDQLKWFDKTLAENAASNKPIFVFIHQPLYNTVAGSKDGQGCGNDLAQDTQVRQILAKYPQAILFTGHTHWEFGSKDVTYNAKACTMIGIPSCGYCWTDANAEDDISEGYYVEVYNDKVLVKGRNFTTREWDKTSQYQVNYAGTPENSSISIQNNGILNTALQLNKLSLKADKNTLLLNGSDTAKLILNGAMSDGSKADLTNATIEYSSDDAGVANVDISGIVKPTGVGTANITARVTLNGVTESVTQQINVGKIKTNANLSGIAIDNKALPDFSEDTLKYTVALSDKDKVPTLTATSDDSDAKVIVNQAQTVNGTATILVTSADGTVTKTYMVNFKVGSSENSSVETPVFSLDSSKFYTEKQNLSITCKTEGATIRYTTDGTDPTEQSPVYSSPIVLDDTTTVRAIAIKDGLDSSDIVSANYNIQIPTGTEIIQNGDFSNGDTGWTHYNGVDNSPYGVENGEYKTTVGQLGDYFWSVQLNQGDFALKKNVSYRLTFNANSTITRNIEVIIEEDETAADHPVYLDKIISINPNMNTYSFDFTMPSDEAKAHIVFGMGKVAGLDYAESHDVSIGNVSLRDLPPIAAAPTFSVQNGTYSLPQTVTISSDTEGATIRYTTDGTNPTATSQVYTAPITVSSNTTIKAYAVKDGLADSKISGATYKFTDVAAPEFSLPNGVYYGPQAITLTSATEGATIRYTTDGTEPTINSKIYTGPIIISSNVTIKAYAIKDGHNSSSIVSGTYVINSIIITPPIPKPETRSGSVSIGGGQGSAIEVPITRTTDNNGVKTDTVQIDKNKANEIIQAALKANIKTITITAADIPQNTADKVVVNILSDSILQFINNTIGLVIDTAKAKAELPINTVKGLNNEALQFEIDDVKDSSSLAEINNSILELVPGAVLTGNCFDIKTNYSGRTKITIPFKNGQAPSKDELSSLAVMIKHGDGETSVDKGTIVYDESGNPIGISVWVNKFSSFTLIKVPDTYFDGTTTVIPNKVSTNKEWQIKFSKEADKSTINSDNIYVLDSKGNKVDINISYGLDDVLKISPANAYISGQVYSLYISKNVMANDKTPLTNALKYNFTVE